MFWGLSSPPKQDIAGADCKILLFRIFCPFPLPLPPRLMFWDFKVLGKKTDPHPPLDTWARGKNFDGREKFRSMHGGLCMGGLLHFFGGGMARGEKNSQQSTSFACHFAPFLLKQEQTFVETLERARPRARSLYE